VRGALRGNITAPYVFRRHQEVKMAEDHFEETESEDDAQSNVEERLDDLDSKVEELKNEGRGEAAGAVVYSLGATLAMILSWHSFHAVIWAVLAGMFSWLYVFYYLVVHWSDVKLL
jgi:dienelactone hydrolase